MVRFIKLIFTILIALSCIEVSAQTSEQNDRLTINWQTLLNEATATENVPHPLLEGAFNGVLNDTLIVAGGLLSHDNGEYLDKIWTARKSISSDNPTLNWQVSDTTLPTSVAHGITVSAEIGVFIIGGTNATVASSKVHLLRSNPINNEIVQFELPSMPFTMTDGAATVLDNKLYVIADNQFLVFDFSQITFGSDGISLANMNESSGWEKLPLPPEQNQFTANAVIAAQHDGQRNLLYTLPKVTDIASPATFWAFQPDERSWQRKSSVNFGAAGEVSSALPISQSHLLFFLDNQDQRTQTIYSYNAITDAWAPFANNEGLDNQNFVNVLNWNNQIILINSDANSFSISEMVITRSNDSFGWQNSVVVIVYLLLVVLIGVYFAFKNKNTNDYFRGGQHVPWWAAGCSIYATMLSSLTYVAVPALIYRTDWLLFGATLMILVVSPIAIYMALPFFRQIDATSAYEYLSKRFNMPVRLFASALFTFFHFGRIGIVLALTALALSAVTPLTAWQAILIMGGLSLIYSTLGGVEAVIWTDTLQTLVLFVGAIVCFVIIIGGIEGGFSGFLTAGMEENKFRMVDWNFGPESIKTWAIWVIVLGGLGQGISSYTADQATVQRYMTTKSTKEAAKSIWTNAFLAIPSGVLFLSIGTGLYVFYKSKPEKLDPTLQIDQVFPYFIATELPVVIAGLIIAGIFAAAQSTVSTSINSIATTLVTDFMRPFALCKDEQGYLKAARILSFVVGLLGTFVGLLFISPEIRSLAEEYYKVIGMFMGALGGLFLLGMTTRRTNGWGALIGIFVGVAAMMSAWLMEWADGFLFATIGIIVSMITGYLASVLIPDEENDLQGLTLYTMKRKDQ